jgi:hypothetical protein
MALSFSVPDTELSTTLHNRRAEVVDNIFKGTVLMSALKRYNAVQMDDGGLEIVQPLRFTKNTSVGSFDGYDLLDTTPQDSETSIRVPWAQDYATISISLTEEKKNQGRGRLLNLLNQKIDDAMVTVKDLLNIQMLQVAPAAGSKDPISITEIVQTTPTASPARVASIGNISGTTNTWWRNKATAGGSFSVSDINTMYNNVSDGFDFPDLLISGQTVFEHYENSLVGQIRYADTKMADAGFQSLLFKQTPFVWDPNIGITDSLYFLNFEYLKLCIMQGMDFITTDFIEPDNQAAKVAKLLFMGNLVCTARRRQGTLSGITAPA